VNDCPVEAVRARRALRQADEGVSKTAVPFEEGETSTRSRERDGLVFPLWIAALSPPLHLVHLCEFIRLQYTTCRLLTTLDRAPIELDSSASLLISLQPSHPNISTMKTSSAALIASLATLASVANAQLPSGAPVRLFV
jgi:hypothetical protein